MAGGTLGSLGGSDEVVGSWKGFDGTLGRSASVECMGRDAFEKMLLSCASASLVWVSDG